MTRRVKGELPPVPTSYFDLLSQEGAERLDLPNQRVVALATTLHCEHGRVFLSEHGRFLCPHGNPFETPALDAPKQHESPVKKAGGRGRFTTNDCACQLALPNRGSFPDLPLATGSPAV